MLAKFAPFDIADYLDNEETIFEVGKSTSGPSDATAASSQPIQSGL